MAPSTALSQDVLLVLITLADAPSHGYAIMRHVETRSNGRTVLQAGALYRILKRLLAAGWIVERDSPADSGAGDQRRRTYGIAPAGRAAMRRELDRMEMLVRAGRAATRGHRPGLA